MNTTQTAPSTTTSATTAALTVNADALTRALRLTAHGLLKTSRGGLPIHRGVQLRATSGTLTLTTFNGQTSVRAALPADPPANPATTKATTPGGDGVAVIVEHAQLRAALKGLPRSAHVALSLTANGVTVTTPAGAFVFLRLGDGVFPLLPAPVTAPAAPGAVALFVAPAGELAAGVKAVNRAASTDETLPILCGLSVHAVSGEPVTISATDRYRYARYSTPGTWYGPELARPRIVLPARPFAAVCAALPRQNGADAPVSLIVDADAAAGTGHGWATLTVGTGTEEVSATFAVIDGEYPRVEALWPAAVAHNVEVPAAALAAAARQVAALQERNRPIALHLGLLHDADADAVTIATDPGALPDPTTGAVARQEVRVPLPAVPAGHPANSVDLDAPVGLNPAFLADALDSFAGTVTLAGTDNALRPWTFTDDGPVRVLLMPVKLNIPETPVACDDTPAATPVATPATTSTD